MEKIRIKNCTCKLEYFDIDNILIDEKSHANILKIFKIFST